MKRLTARLTSTRFAKQVNRKHAKGAGLAVPVSGVNVACPRGNLPGAISPGQSHRGQSHRGQSHRGNPLPPMRGIKRGVELVSGDWFLLFAGGRVAGGLAGNKS